MHGNDAGSDSEPASVSGENGNAANCHEAPLSNVRFETPPSEKPVAQPAIAASENVASFGTRYEATSGTG